MQQIYEDKGERKRDETRELLKVADYKFQVTLRDND